jgi:hypothetical protein
MTSREAHEGSVSIEHGLLRVGMFREDVVSEEYDVRLLARRAGRRVAARQYPDARQVERGSDEGEEPHLTKLAPQIAGVAQQAGTVERISERTG